MYYAAKNTYANPVSIGGYNSWYVVVFATKRERDLHVADATDLATRAILKREITSYAGGYGRDPIPFTRDHWCVDTCNIKGAIGCVIAYRYSSQHNTINLFN